MIIDMSSSLPLKESVKAKWLGENARRLFNL